VEGPNVIRITFPQQYPLDDLSIRYVQGFTGLYFIFLESLAIPYPFNVSRLIYIGMSDSKQNSIGNRLRDHKSGQSGNIGIMNYAFRHKVNFAYLRTDMLKVLGSDKALELESFFLTSFSIAHGSYPICNNQSGISFPNSPIDKSTVLVDWGFFQGT
jgi:hypothetical protein